MLEALNHNNEHILAKNAIKNVDYYCPHCHSKLILKKGIKVMPHFAHESQSQRWCAKGESELHYHAKYQLATMLKRLGYTVRIEPFYKLINQLPDIVVNDKIALELQFSMISLSKIRLRSDGLNSIGLHPIWIVKDIKYDKSKMMLSLSDFQASTIDCETKRLLTWNEQDKSPIVYSDIQHIGGKTFKARRQTLINYLDKANKLSHSSNTIYKLSNQKILKYIQRCRWKNSVLEPTLSAMYQLQLFEDKVAYKVGFIVPHQIYIKTHPIEWQLQLLLLEKEKRLNYQYFEKCLEFRQFSNSTKAKIEIIKAIIMEYQYAINLNSKDVQIIY
ncbi:competence protein CoiA [Staphylococcus pasteuri]|uniref:competence protein CoiA n=1 Tax=Staphylococcus pasteuri TaxID=45972 RepID=UPI000F84C541|nr:competence protein CoiA family protein [Staphylococcus pasteuri]MEB6611934.1 transcription factor [Staphylococcus pasteuri]QDW84982.1 transcription factor [Staphylococcus pasteuri]QQN53477.1 transcription factor [Staphylococcus pasteuri]RTX71342.1 transcription factor [Staphylococcus pasteuri]